MELRYKAEFKELPWERPAEGVRHKCVERDGVRIRLVEYTKEMSRHWCERGHYGYVIEGRLEIEYENGNVTYDPGDCICIPNGPAHKHRGRVLSGKATVFFVETT